MDIAALVAAAGPVCDKGQFQDLPTLFTFDWDDLLDGLAVLQSKQPTAADLRPLVAVCNLRLATDRCLRLPNRPEATRMIKAVLGQVGRLDGGPQAQELSGMLQACLGDVSRWAKYEHAATAFYTAGLVAMQSAGTPNMHVLQLAQGIMLLEQGDKHQAATFVAPAARGILNQPQLFGAYTQRLAATALLSVCGYSFEYFPQLLGMPENTEALEQEETLLSRLTYARFAMRDEADEWAGYYPPLYRPFLTGT